MTLQLSRADLLRCLAAHDFVEPDKLAAALGYEPRRDAASPAAVSSDGPLGTGAITTENPPPTPPPQSPAPQALFLRPLSHRRLGSGEGVVEAPEWFRQAKAFGEDDPAIAAPPNAKPPPAQPLLPWPRLWPFLKLALGASLASGQPDVPRVVAALARGEWLRRMPRTRRRGWAAECLLVIDFAEPLRPFWGDFHALKTRLRGLRGEAGLTVIAFPDGDPQGRCWRGGADDWQVLGRVPLPPPGTPVLVLSDLGCNDREPSRRRRWLRFGARLKAAGCRPVALTPCPPRRWDAELARLFALACWDRAARLPRHLGRVAAPVMREEEALTQPSPAGRGLDAPPLDPLDDASPLLALLSAAVRVEPRLLRAARHLLPAAQADVGTEASAWNHADVCATETAFYYDPSAQRGHRERFGAMPPALQTALASLVARHHAHLSPFILHEEAAVFIRLIGAAAWAEASGQTGEDLLQAQRRLAKTCAAAGGVAAAAQAWVGRMAGRCQPEALWQDDDALAAAWAFAHKDRRGEAPLPPGLSLQRVAWALGGGGAQAWRLSQIGRALHAEAAASEPASARPTVATLEAAGWVTLSGIGEASMAALGDFFDPKLRAEAAPSAAALLSLIHPAEDDAGPETEAGRRAFPARQLPETPVFAGAQTGLFRPTLLSLDQPIPLPKAGCFRLRSDAEEWIFDQIAKPEWADAIGRDRDGLFVELRTDAERLRLYWQPATGQRGALALAGHWGGFEALGLDRFGLWADLALYVGREFTADDAVDAPLGHFERIVQRFRRMPPGQFLMGSPKNEPERESWGNDETQHEVTLSQGFWLADSACTQALWQAVMDGNPSRFNDNADNPVETVSWHDAQAFVAALNAKVAGLEARLPTEAEWEYACRAGTVTPFSFGANLTPEQVNYDGNYPYAGGEKGLYRERTVPVKSLPPNPWGLYEMHGNVWEWCQDGLRDYTKEPQTDPVGPSEGRGRVLRGGSWISDGRFTRSAHRSGDEPDYRHDYIGFRLALGPPASQPARAAAGPG